MPVAPFYDLLTKTYHYINKLIYGFKTEKTEFEG